MPFTAAEQTAILQATGEDVQIILSGVVVSTIRAKFRRDVEVFDPYSAGVVGYKPGLLVRASDMSGITSSHGFRVAGVDYDQSGAPQEQNDGFVRVILTKTPAPQYLRDEDSHQRLAEEGTEEKLTT